LTGQKTDFSRNVRARSEIVSGTLEGVRGSQIYDLLGVEMETASLGDLRREQGSRRRRGLVLNVFYAGCGVAGEEDGIQI
jgi:hypothetical protein